MEELNGFYILENDGQILFQYELFLQGSRDFDPALFSGVVMAMQSFVQNLGEKKFDQMELGKSRVFVSKDEELHLILVLKTAKNVNQKKYSKLLEQIQKGLRQYYYDRLFSQKDLRNYIKTSFKRDLEELIGSSMKKRMKDFLQSL